MKDGANRIRCCVAVAVCALVPILAHAGPCPAWWTNRNVISTGAVTNDYALANAGQVKWIASNACAELNAKLPGGAGSAITAAITGFSRSNNYMAVNSGQLKNLAKLFYNRLISEGCTNSYPWTTNTASDDADYSAVNIGQVKNVFSFGLSWDTDHDGMVDDAEMRIVSASTKDNIETVNQVLPNDDFDGDGVSNADEMRLGTDPTNPNSVPPRLGFLVGEQTVAEAATNKLVYVTVRLTPAATATVSGLVSVQSGTATAANDYIFTNQTVAFTPGQTNKLLAVTIIADQASKVVEPQERVVFQLTGLSGPAVYGANRNHVILINDYATDTDGDGLPDWWEQQYFGSVTGAVAIADGDADGWNNLQEYRRRGNPLQKWISDSNSVMKLSVLSSLRGKK